MKKIIGLLALVLIYFVVNHTSLLSPQDTPATAPIESVQDLTPVEAIEPPPEQATVPESKPQRVDADADPEAETDTDADAETIAATGHAEVAAHDKAKPATKTLADTKAKTTPIGVAVDEQAPKQPASTGLVSADAEINKTLKLIQQGGPFPHKQDDTIFQNRERILPKQPRGYYREYTVRTPGTKTRGARRIVTGGHPPTEYYYTPDHYRTFHKLEANHDLP
ncbi:MAG: hypothetical protein KBC57_06015 [Neisseriaceae bacterium]|nr:hypothetical protein [Neisseriaceae bacterium]MBP6861895.1 hypothetical protein [Neisseriaceae bacterium]